MSVEVILSKLKKVKRVSHNSWMACCSAHDDRSPSLSVTDNGNGKLMLKCFAGCETIDVLGAIGLDWDDVMPPKEATARTQTMKPQTHKIYATDAMRVIKTEAQIITMAAMDIQKGIAINEPEMKRIKLAMERIKTLTEASTNG